MNAPTGLRHEALIQAAALRSALLQTRIELEMLDRERDTALAAALVGVVEEAPRAAGVAWPSCGEHAGFCDCDDCLNGGDCG